jgi:hypothetical protein
MTITIIDVWAHGTSRQMFIGLITWLCISCLIRCGYEGSPQHMAFCANHYTKYGQRLCSIQRHGRSSNLWLKGRGELVCLQLEDADGNRDDEEYMAMSNGA